MSREQRLARAFVSLSDTLSDDFDPLMLFHRLVDDCVTFLDVDAAGVMMADARGGLRVMASSSEEAAFLELLQLQGGAGPCVDCYRSGEAVGVCDISREEARWPAFVPPALEAGYRSLHTVPLRLHERVIGAVNLFRHDMGELPHDDEQVAQALADVAALALMHWSREPTNNDEVVTQVQSALAAKAILETAKGMVAQHASVSIEEATRHLRAYSERHRIRLTDTAQALTHGTLDLTAVSTHAGQELT
ncbi:GAF and ANTAR domain-containing protein [Streptomyces sp. NPDC005393]|uniref:GAF and ANTAR domain-containing protein n=1 Tax=Streptomyces sp. NPDC005393 TaxID=3157041 RepID=UPI0033BECF52